MSLPPDWWTTGLDNEPCDGCGVTPSKHEGHGKYTCKTCYEARWCPSCKYSLAHPANGRKLFGVHQHECVTPEEHAKNQAELREFYASVGMEYPDEQ